MIWMVLGAGEVGPVCRRLFGLVAELMVEGAANGAPRDGVPAGELAVYRPRFLGTAAALPPKAAARRFVAVASVRLSPAARSADRTPVEAEGAGP
ncbi:hypothetical protein ACH4A8_16140 [Streptomyces vietnamensis]|uniref:hypothetical protein n=1 Tax=Streptomyces vietnamensis TaxID=362257 RepID=UPI0037A743B5